MRGKVTHDRRASRLSVRPIGRTVFSRRGRSAGERSRNEERAEDEREESGWVRDLDERQRLRSVEHDGGRPEEVGEGPGGEAG
jgi:hypothetical protein